MAGLVSPDGVSASLVWGNRLSYVAVVRATLVGSGD